VNRKRQLPSAKIALAFTYTVASNFWNNEGRSLLVSHRVGRRILTGEERIKVVRLLVVGYLRRRTKQAQRETMIVETV
jgi:hypothetical protein